MWSFISDSWTQDAPAKHKYDGEDRNQLQHFLLGVRCHDGKLQEIEQVEMERVSDVVTVNRHLTILPRPVKQRTHGAVLQTRDTLNQHA